MGPYWPLLAVAVAAILTLRVAVLVLVPHPLSSQGNPAARLAVSVATDQETYLPGQSVIVSVQVTNAGDGIAYVLFGSTCLASYSILTVDGSVVYDYRAHAACGELLTNLTLKPGEARVFTFAWTQVSDSGIPVLAFRSYRIQGILLSAKPSPGPLRGNDDFRHEQGRGTEPRIHCPDGPDDLRPGRVCQCQRDPYEHWSRNDRDALRELVLRAVPRR